MPGFGSVGRRTIAQEDVQGFTAADRVKLSYHADGFAQFSGEQAGRIESGRDSETGKPKGVGLLTHPLNDPINSGPSVGLQAWGLEEFELLKDGEEATIFEPDQIYYRACHPEEACHWIVMMYAFSSLVVPPVRYERGHTILDAALEGLGGPRLSVVRLSVLHLPTEKLLLGLAVYATSECPPHPSGWIMAGPGDYALGKDGHMLMAFYPPGAVGPNFGSVDRQKPTVAN